jgi:hypothetical protein
MQDCTCVCTSATHTHSHVCMYVCKDVSAHACMHARTHPGMFIFGYRGDEATTSGLSRGGGGHCATAAKHAKQAALLGGRLVRGLSRGPASQTQQLLVLGLADFLRLLRGLSRRGLLRWRRRRREGGGLLPSCLTCFHVPPVRRLVRFVEDLLPLPSGHLEGCGAEASPGASRAAYADGSARRRRERGGRGERHRGVGRGGQRDRHQNLAGVQGWGGDGGVGCVCTPAVGGVRRRRDKQQTREIKGRHERPPTCSSQTSSDRRKLHRPQARTACCQASRPQRRTHPLTHWRLFPFRTLSGKQKRHTCLKCVSFVRKKNEPHSTHSCTDQGQWQRLRAYVRALAQAFGRM